MNKCISRSAVLVLILVGLHFTSCGRDSQKQPKVEPAQVEHVEGSELSRVTLTEKAIERLGIQTAPVRESHVSRSESPRKVVPYASVLYDAHGKTWVYKSPEPRLFVRHSIDVDYIEGDLAILSDGPPAGTDVVTVGVAELYGTEFEIGH